MFKTLCYLFMCIVISFAAPLMANKKYVFNPKDQHHRLYKPEGRGPFPAILLLHASTGVIKVDYDWAERLKKDGYVVYIIDSFTPRGWKDRVAVGWEQATDAQLADVAPAYHYLSQLPEVDPRRIGILGFSMGGFDVLRVMEKVKEHAADFQNLPFKAAASFYGVCHRLNPKSEIKGATTIFIGDKDDRATTEDCKALVQRSAKNHDVFIKLYPNAEHGFDNYEFPSSKKITDEKGESYHIGYNKAARLASLKDLPAFFKAYLK